MAEKDTKPVTVYLDEETDLHYIKGVTKILFDNGVVVDRARFESYVAKKMPTSPLIKEALADPASTGFDFDYARRARELKRKSDTPVAKIEEPPVVEVAPPVDILVKETEEKPIPEAHKAKALFSSVSSMNDSEVILGIIGVFSMVMSMYHSFTFLTGSGKPVWVAFITSMIMVLFAATAFHSSKQFFVANIRAVFGLLLTVIGIGVVFYLVFSTIAVNYDQFTVKELIKQTTAVESSQAVKTVDNSISTNDTALAQVSADIDSYRKDSDVWQATMSQNSTPDENGKFSIVYSVASRNYTLAQTNLKAAIAKRDALYNAKTVQIEKKDTVVETAKAGRETVYTLMSSKIGIKESTIRFIVYTIPATFFDVVSPLALSIVLLLRDEQKKRKEEKV